MKKLMAVALTMGMALSLAGVSRADMGEHGEEASMKMHHIHILMGHAVGMVTEGSNLVMIAGMKMSPGTDAMTADHGKKMIDNGKGVLQRALSGDEMMKMHKEGMKDDPMMKDSHSLGESILKYIDIVQKMKMDTMDKDMMDMHHMHLMINHALAMAAEGSNLVMLGDMKMAGDLDKYTVDHGRKMLKDAKATLAGVSDNKAMMGMHKAGKGPKDDPMMAETHNLIETALKIINYFEKM
jgi:hypothetical protein